MPKKKEVNFKNIADFCFEAGMLAYTQRSGFPHLALDTHKQNDAEHICRMSLIGIALASIVDADVGRVAQMCLFHDLVEVRTGDPNYLNQKYFQNKKRAERKARKDLAKTIPFGRKMMELLEEFEKSETLESKIARDSDQIELLLSIKELMDIGNKVGKSWIPSLLQRIKTEEGKKLAEAILGDDFDHWWFKDKNDQCWVDPLSRGKK